MEPHPLSSGDLVAFVAAFEAGTIHGASDALGLTPSAVTKRVQSLERRTGATLFDRGRLGLRPTASAQRLYPPAKEALAALRAAHESLGDGTADGLVLAASHTIGEYLLPAWIAAFRGRDPEVRPRIDVINSPGVLLAVRERRAAIGFVEGRDPLDGLDVLTVQRDEIVAVVAHGHRWESRRSVAARELHDEPWLAREEGSGTRAVAAAALAAAGVTLSPMLEVASTESVKRALRTGGFALLSRLAIAADVRAGTLHALPVRGLDLARELRAVRLRDRHRPRHQTAFWSFLASLEPR
ncbi:MAG TPA: LysR family transcriptional regulator [Baekduia sp.]|uniref:LysR family transcriptional regulator n=1 Tax=Baekduia sp. TaxID=2600305 RepID=UPI002D77EE52|nr:LysR family transcriptional regulator [Baekduia sp.]HET6506051.1 LysR family transcriptional regulator [Baekduia sp.]